MYASSLFSISLIFFSAAVAVVLCYRGAELPSKLCQQCQQREKFEHDTTVYFCLRLCAVGYFAYKHQRIGLIMLHCLVILVVLALTHIATSQTISVNTDSNAFLCKTEMDCSQFYTGTARQGEW